MNLRLSKRFWEKVTPNLATGCWEWMATKNQHGYGNFRFEGKMLKSHRLSYSAFKGPIPDSLCVCHRCDNPSCVNPRHLFAATHHENMIDKEKKGRGNQIFGELHYAAKLTEQDVLSIRKDSRPQRKIAIAYGVSKSLIAFIKLRQRWSYLP